MSNKSIRSASITGEAREALARARSELPTTPLREHSTSTGLSQWEVVVAYNLDAPYRYTQEFFWLEVLASCEHDAINIAAKWVLDSDDNFEATDLVRKSSPHDQNLGVGEQGEPLPIFWNLPVDEALRAGTVIRNPITGLRVGFIATEKQERQWLHPFGIERYRLLMRKPSRDAQPVGLAPLVQNLGPLRYLNKFK